MKRVSTYMANHDMHYYLKQREFNMNELQNKIAGQTRINNLRDDPVAAAHSVRFKSSITRMEQFSKNAVTVRDKLRISEGYMQETVDILQRVRELAIQGAQGTFSKQETQYMAEEVNQLLNELVEIGNARSGDGSFLFSGTDVKSPAFRALEGHVPGGTGNVITHLEYTGTIQENKAEVSEGSYVTTGFAGNIVFWAEQQTMIASNDVTNYQVQADNALIIDGTSIDLKAGDTIHAIIAKINDANVAVRAKLDPVQNSLVLQTTTPHQLWLEDGKDGSVLQDLGVLSERGNAPPNNVASDVRITGGSTFDMIMSLRDKLYQGDSIDIGGMALRGIDSALENVLTSMAELGAQDERLSYISKRMESEIPQMIGRDSREVDLDMSKAITDLKMMEYVHKAALQTAGRILQPTLLDFLR